VQSPRHESLYTPSMVMMLHHLRMFSSSWGIDPDSVRMTYELGIPESS
jgi:hypothetical protein